MSGFAEVAFIVIAMIILAIASLVSPTERVRKLQDDIYCTNGHRPIVHRERVVGCQRGWRV